MADSFGPSANVQNAESGLAGNAKAASGAAPTAFNTGTSLIGQGQGTIAGGTNFLNTILNGNSTNTASLLQPSIDQIRGGNQEALQQTSTLMPRGGGRSGALFDLSTQPQRQIQNLFNTARTGAATALPQIGIAQAGLGANLFNSGTSALNAGTNANSAFGNLDLEQQKISNAKAAALGSGIFNLATTPLGGWGSQSLFGKVFS